MTWTPQADVPKLVPADDPRWKDLRAPFPDSQIGHKPQPWCRACVNNKQDKHCDRHALISCKVCRQRITVAHIDLDFVGHAAVTQRLLEVDPHWDWEPMTEAQRKQLGFRSAGENGMWIWLTVLGKKRPGLGEIEGTQLTGGNAEKSLISDAIKNAAMRFGVAIQTWSKEDLADKAAADSEAAEDARRVAGEPTPSSDSGVTPGRNWAQDIGMTQTQEEFDKLVEECKLAGALQGAALNAARTRRRELKAKTQDAPAEQAAGEPKEQ